MSVENLSQQKIFNYEYKIAILWLKMFFKTRGRFSELRPSMRDDWEKSSRLIKNIVNHLLSEIGKFYM